MSYTSSFQFIHGKFTRAQKDHPFFLLFRHYCVLNFKQFVTADTVFVWRVYFSHFYDNWHRNWPKQEFKWGIAAWEERPGKSGWQIYLKKNFYYKCDAFQCGPTDEIIF